MLLRDWAGKAPRKESAFQGQDESYTTMNGPLLPHSQPFYPLVGESGGKFGTDIQ